MMDVRFSIQLRDRKVWIQPYKFDYVGESGNNVPIYFLDTDSFEEKRNRSVIMPKPKDDNAIIIRPDFWFIFDSAFSLI